MGVRREVHSPRDRALARRMTPTCRRGGGQLDLLGKALSARAGTIVSAARSGTWGFVRPKPKSARVARTLSAIWSAAGGVVIAMFVACGETGDRRGRVCAHRNRDDLRQVQLREGSISFLSWNLHQAGISSVVPLFRRSPSGSRRVATGVGCRTLAVVVSLGRRCSRRMAHEVSHGRVVRLGFMICSPVCATAGH